METITRNGRVVLSADALSMSKSSFLIAYASDRDDCRGDFGMVTGR